MATSFASFVRKSGEKTPQISGTKSSLHNAHLLVSTGIPSLDFILGGGLPTGSVILIEEDCYGNTAKTLLKYFLAEGVVSKHSLLLASGDIQPSQIIKNLPSLSNDDTEVTGSNKPAYDWPGDDSMKIAWRYEDLPQMQSIPRTKQSGRYFDLSKSIPEEDLRNIDIRLFDVIEASEMPSDAILMESPYQDLLSLINKTLKEKHFRPSEDLSTKKNILRIGIKSFGSLLWKTKKSSTITKFLHLLRASLRCSYGVCFITVPTHIIQDASMVLRIRNLSDAVINLESFEGSDKETNPLFKDYHGLFHIVKLPHLNSLTCHMPDTMNFVYKLKKRKFVVEKLHLPPDLQETASRPQEDPLPDKQKHLTIGCGIRRGSGGSSKLDF